jgi:5-formyltetrahydrofolate cyclo-ligase
MTLPHDPMDDDGDSPGSPPCLLHLLGPDGMSDIDPQQARDVARWRKVERERLIAARLALPAPYRAAQAAAIAGDLNRMIPSDRSAIISLYWPIRAEPDLRPWMRAIQAQGVRVALPVAVALRQPLVFREWRPQAPLARGLWNIPYPADGIEVIPTVVLAPLVGFDVACCRLGYGGGFFDRTLAALADKPLVIGVGYPGARIPTIFPQPYDIPMDWIVTGSLPPVQRAPAALTPATPRQHPP